MAKRNGDDEDLSLSYCNCLQCRKLRGEVVTRPLVSSNSPKPPTEKSRILTTHDLDSKGKTKEQRFWDKEKTLRKPAFVTGDVALSRSEEGDKKRAAVMAEIKKSKEEKNEKQKKGN